MTPLTAQETYQMIVEEAIRLNNANYGSLVLEDEGNFIEVYSTLPIRLQRSKKGSTFKAYKENKPYVLYKEDFMEKYPSLVELKIESIVFIPVSYKKKSIGVLIINSARNAQYSPEQLAAFSLFGSLASLVIKKMQLYDETKDSLDLRDKFISLAAPDICRAPAV